MLGVAIHSPLLLPAPVGSPQNNNTTLVVKDFNAACLLFAPQSRTIAVKNIGIGSESVEDVWGAKSGNISMLSCAKLSAVYFRGVFSGCRSQSVASVRIHSRCDSKGIFETISR